MLVKNKRSNTILVVVAGFAVILMISVVIAVIVISSRQAKLPDNISNESINSTINTQPNNSSNNNSQNSSNKDGANDTTTTIGDLKGRIISQDIVASTLQIRTSIDGKISDGSCSLTMTGPNNQTHTDQVNIIANPDGKTSSCNGFDIAISTLNSDPDNTYGKWTINIKLKTKGHTGDINGEVNL